MPYHEPTAQIFREELLNLNINEVQEKRMFGALGFMVNGKLTVCVGAKDVMYKLGVDQCRSLIEEGVAEPVVMGKRTMKDWVTINFYNIEEPTEFNQYLTSAIKYTASTK